MQNFSTLPQHLQAAYLRDPRLRMAQALQENSVSTAPVQHWLQGAARLAQALASKNRMERVGGEYEQKAGAYQQALAKALGGFTKSGDATGFSDPALGEFGQTAALNIAMSDRANANALKVAEVKRQGDLQDLLTEIGLKSQYDQYEEARKPYAERGMPIPAHLRTLGDWVSSQGSQPAAAPAATQVQATSGDAPGSAPSRPTPPDPSSFTSPAAYDAAMKGYEKRVEEQAKVDVETATELPKTRRKIMTELDRLPSLRATVKELTDTAGSFFTGGVVGQALSNFANSDQYAMNQKVKEIKALVGLDELIAAKEQGATFGSLTENEMSLLIAKAGTLDPLLESFPEDLQEVLTLYEKGLAGKLEDLRSKSPGIAREIEQGERGGLIKTLGIWQPRDEGGNEGGAQIQTLPNGRKRVTFGAVPSAQTKFNQNKKF